MSTFYQRYRRYLSSPNTIPFGRKKIQVVSNRVKRIWDKKNKDIFIPYVESKEGDKIFKVRMYPAAFTKIIDDEIFKECVSVKKNKAASFGVKKRKRIPIKRKA